MGCLVSPLSVIRFFIRWSYRSAGLRSEAFRIDEDTTIHCWLSRSLVPPSEKRSRPVLLLVHGMGTGGMFQWKSQVRALSAKFDLIVPDLLFFGRSFTKSSARSEVFQASCLARLVDILIGPERKFSVIGTSYGGFIAYHIAHMCGMRVTHVVIASSDLLKSDDGDRALAAHAHVDNVSDLLLPSTTKQLRTLISHCVHQPPRCLPEFLLRDILHRVFQPNMEEKMQLVKDITLCKDGHRLTPLPQEAMIVWGDQDMIFPLDKAFQIQKNLGGKVRVEIIKNAGHVPQEEDSKSFNQIILDFLLGGTSKPST